MRAIIGKLSLLALATGLAGGAIVVGCSSNADKTQSEKSVGTVGFNLDVGSNHINTIHVVVSGNGITPIVQDVDVSEIPGNTVSFDLTLPAGAGYQVTLTTDNANCAGTGTFSVTAGGSNSVDVIVQCAAPVATGTVGVGVSANTCPAIQSVFAAPSTVPVGGKVSLGVTPTPGSTVSFAWTATAGTFDNATIASPKYTCTTAGTQTVTITISNPGCTDSRTKTITCTNGGGGGSGGTSGGATSGGATSGGATSGGATSGGATSGGATSGGATSGGATSGGATSGGATSGGGTGVAMCPAPVSNVLGTQTCTASFTSNECGTNCAQITPAACLTCEETSPDTTCYGSTSDGSSVLDGNLVAAIAGSDTTATGASRFQLYQSSLECIRTSNCAKTNALNCYCGTAGSTCSTPGQANGPCRASLEAALETTDPATVFQRFSDPSFAGGLALIRVGCDQTDCASTCFK